jgi:guanylate kinase
LEKRLRGRGTDSEEAIQKRLAQAKNEIEYCKTEGKHDKVIINDDLDRAYKELDEWVMKDLSAST